MGLPTYDAVFRLHFVRVEVADGLFGSDSKARERVPAPAWPSQVMNVRVDWYVWSGFDLSTLLT